MSAEIAKFMGVSIGNIDKILGVSKTNLSKIMGLDLPAGYVFLDTFTGANGSDPNSTYWNPNQYFEIQSNQLHGSVNGAKGYVASKFTLSGDFDIYVSFDDLVTATGEGNRIDLIAISGDTQQTALIGGRYKLGNAVFSANIENDGVWGSESFDSRVNDYGMLRIERSGTTITCKYRDGTGNWVSLKTGTIGSDDLRVRLFIYSLSGNVSGDFDDFTIDTGTMEFP